MCHIAIFQLTAPRGGRPRAGLEALRARYISTHGPARGPTQFHFHQRKNIYISTHGPARGPTYSVSYCVVQIFISTHGPARGPTVKKKLQCGCTKFQLTAPRGGRRIKGIYDRVSFRISTHGPARGPTAILDNDPLSKIVFFILLHNFKDFSITFLYGFFFFHTKSAFFQVRIFWEFSGHLAFARKLHVKQTFSIHSPH